MKREEEMKESYKDRIIISNEEISPNIYRLVLKGDFKGNPGQFYMLKAGKTNDPFLPRPLSISNLEDGRMTFLYEVFGKGTEIISNYKEGDRISLLGPLGNGFRYKDIKGKIGIITGGAGIAPMLYLSKGLGKDVDLYAGFRDVAYYIDEFDGLVDRVKVATETGKDGYKGYALDLLNPEEYDYIYTCGPTPMTRAVINKCKGKTNIIVSMENRMACGIGGCIGCSIKTKTGRKRVCKEGPIFNGEELVFDE